MYLRTIGKPSKVDIKLCKEAVKFYGKFLLGENLYHKISLELEFDKSIIKSRDLAYCGWEDNNHKSREFVISVSPILNKKLMLVTLAHEMVHVKQYAKGELKDYIKVNKSKWKGEIIDNEQIDYWFLPWEIEAHGMEKGLYVKYIEYLRKKNN
jgi:hypothetical protein